MNIGMYRPYKVFVSKDVVVNATGLADLDNGELAVLKSDGTLLAAGETIADSEWIYIAQGTATAGQPILSQRIKGASVTNWSGAAYSAKVEQVSYIGWNGTTGAISAAGIDTGDVLKVRINFPFDKELRSLRTWARYFEYTAVADNVGETAVDNLVAQINADPVCKDYLTAAKVSSGTDHGIRLTAKALTHTAHDNLDQVTFEVFIDGDFETTTYVDQFGYIEAAGGKTTTNKASVSPYRGVGTYNVLLDLERFALGFWGHTNRTLFPVNTPDTYAVSGETYHFYMIEWTDEMQANDLSINKNLHQLIVAVPNGAANSNDVLFEGLLNPYMASCPGAFANVNL